MLRILGIETSCDDTGVAVYCSENGVISNKIYSQDIHKLYGGVVPELASRDHIKRIYSIIYSSLKEANISITDIDAIAYTVGPGLNGSLLVGAAVANGIGFGLNKPVIAVHHLEGHILSPLLNKEKPQTPFIALLVSGGHTQLILVESIGRYIILGETLDDAAGETFDKIAKMLNYDYPGGVHIANLATKGKDIYNFTRPMINSNNLDMSFSGLKTSVNLKIKQLRENNKSDNDFKFDIAKSAEEAITDILVKKTIHAVTETKIYNVVIAGGVSSNLTLRNKFKQTNIQVFYPPNNLCTDNGAMIAYVGYLRYDNRSYNYSFNILPRFPFEDINKFYPHNSLSL